MFVVFVDTYDIMTEVNRGSVPFGCSLLLLQLCFKTTCVSATKVLGALLSIDLI